MIIKETSEKFSKANCSIKEMIEATERMEEAARKIHWWHTGFEPHIARVVDVKIVPDGVDVTLVVGPKEVLKGESSNENGYCGAEGEWTPEVSQDKVISEEV